MSVLMTTRYNDGLDNADAGTADQRVGAPVPAASGRLVRLPVERAAPEQRILAVEFRSGDGRSWNAIGGGATVAAAITYAREACPYDATWDAVSWNDLYGD